MQRIERMLGINAKALPMANGRRIATGLALVLSLAVVGIVHAAASNDGPKLTSDPALHKADQGEPENTMRRHIAGALSESRAKTWNSPQEVSQILSFLKRFSTA